MVKMIFHATSNWSKRKEFAPLGSKFLPFKEVAILKKDANEENHCFIQKSPFDVRNFFIVLAKQLHVAGFLKI